MGINNGIKLIQNDKSQITPLYIMCCEVHLLISICKIIGISLSLSQSDHIKRLSQYFKLIYLLFVMASVQNYSRLCRFFRLSIKLSLNDIHRMLKNLHFYSILSKISTSYYIMPDDWTWNNDKPWPRDKHYGQLFAVEHFGDFYI